MEASFCFGCLHVKKITSFCLPFCVVCFFALSFFLLFPLCVCVCVCVCACMYGDGEVGFGG